jgi:hypothetical protein
MNTHLSNEGQECKADPTRGKVLEVGEGLMDRVKNGEYCQCTLYQCMKMEH